MDYKSDVPANLTSEDPWPDTSRKISWEAVLGGAFLGLGTMVTMIMLGVAFGISTFNPWGEENPEKLAVGQSIWWMISGIVALFFAGWATGASLSFATHKSGMLNGLVTWALIPVITLFTAATTAGAVIGAGAGPTQPSVTAMFAWALFVVLVLEGAAAAIGGAMGRDSGRIIKTRAKR